MPDWVCSLKRSTDPFLGKAKIGFDGATLQWNSGKPPSSPDAAPAPAGPPSPGTSTSDSDTLTPSAEPAPRFQLSNLSVHFPLGKLSIITGPTGSGKTAMLTALLGEMELLSGKSHLPKYPEQVNARGLRNSIAYVSQTAWLQQKSIRDNILFGETMDEARYEEVLEACALNPDLDMLEDGDGTEIGAKGVSLRCVWQSCIADHAAAVKRLASRLRAPSTRTRSTSSWTTRSPPSTRTRPSTSSTSV